MAVLFPGCLAIFLVIGGILTLNHVKILYWYRLIFFRKIRAFFFPYLLVLKLILFISGLFHSIFSVLNDNILLFFILIQL